VDQQWGIHFAILKYKQNEQSLIVRNFLNNAVIYLRSGPGNQEDTFLVRNPFIVEYDKTISGEVGGVF
jgi:hypothetical protein